MPSVCASTWGTCALSETAARSTTQTPCAKRARSCTATWKARRVFPTPPGPVRVKKRVVDSRCSTSPISASRPTKLVNWCGTLVAQRVGPCVTAEMIVSGSSIVMLGALPGGKDHGRPPHASKCTSKTDWEVQGLPAALSAGAKVFYNSASRLGITYELLGKRVPYPSSLPRDAALAELARRYFISRGPATIHDFGWWPELTVAEAKTGLEMAAPYLARG